MIFEEWNINDNDGYEILYNTIKEILLINEGSKLSVNDLCKSISKYANFKKIVLKKNGKVRNLNTYMRNKFGGINRFLDLNDKIFGYDIDEKRVYLIKNS